MAQTALQPGQNTALDHPSAPLVLEVTGAVDVTVLVLSADGKVTGDADMVFFNNPAAPGVTLDGPAAVTLRLADLRVGAVRVAVVASPSTQGATFTEIGPLSLTVGPLTFAPVVQGTETALVLVEVYERGGGWKLRALGQGYASGLAGVATEYGIEVGDSAAPPPPAPAIDLAKKPLGRISLAKNGSAKIPLTKADLGQLVLTTTLEWDGHTDGSNSDLDLYALYIDESGAPGAVYYRDLGDLGSPPYIVLDGDSLVPGNETVRVLAGKNRYVLLRAYSALENGAGSFLSYRARVVVDDGAGSRVTVPLYLDDPHSYWVAIAKLDFSDPTSARIEQIESYGLPNAEERPVLHPDGRIEMSAGVVEFKDFDLDDLDDLPDADEAAAQPAAGKSKGSFFKGKKKS